MITISLWKYATLLNKIEKEANPVEGEELPDNSLLKSLHAFPPLEAKRDLPDAERDPRGFAMKFYTEEGNYDLVGNNTPVFFIRDPLKFSDFIHTQKRHPATNCKEPNMF